MALIDFNDDSVAQKPEKKSSGGGNKINYAVFKKDQVTRICLIDPQVMSTNSHYVREKKRYIRCLKDAQLECPICNRTFAALKGLDAKDPKRDNLKRRLAKFRLATNVLVYKQDLQGNPVEPFDVMIAIWKFDRDKYGAIRNIIKEWGDPTKYDLLVSCTDEQFQKVSFAPTKTALYKKDAQTEAYTLKMFTDKRYDVEKIMGAYLAKETIDTMLDEIEAEEKAVPPVNTGGAAAAPTSFTAPQPTTAVPAQPPAAEQKTEEKSSGPSLPDAAEKKTEKKEPESPESPSKFKSLLEGL